MQNNLYKLLTPTQSNKKTVFILKCNFDAKMHKNVLVARTPHQTPLESLSMCPDSFYAP